jgi:hypothetical protein
LNKNAAGFFLALTILAIAFSPAGAYDPLDPNGNITIKWDIVSWTADGYVAAVTMHNFQQYRHIPSPPGWTLGWNWAKKGGDLGCGWWPDNRARRLLQMESR